jgi:hypothetical protein
MATRRITDRPTVADRLAAAELDNLRLQDELNRLHLMLAEIYSFCELPSESPVDWGSAWSRCAGQTQGHILTVAARLRSAGVKCPLVDIYDRFEADHVVNLG